MALPVSNYVLLTNTNAEKGYDLILKVAALLPDVPFLVLASQSPLEEAIRAYENAGLKNVTALGRVADMDPVYQGAAIVAVPSYRFKESFSRVCIEAHRYAKPVIGSDRGNVPYLLEQSGTRAARRRAVVGGGDPQAARRRGLLSRASGESRGELQTLRLRGAGRRPRRADRRRRERVFWSLSAPASATCCTPRR